MASDLDHAKFLKAKFVASYEHIESLLSPEIKNLFESIKDELSKRNFQSPGSISLLYDLNDTVTNYQLFLTEQKQEVIVKKTFTQCLPISQAKFSWELKSQLSNIKRIDDLIHPAPSSPPPLPAPIGKDASFEIHGFVEQEKDIVDLLSGPAPFKAIGIYGMCGTGKTTLVQKVLKNDRVRADFPLVIWRSMSDISKDDLGMGIVKDILSKDLMEDIDRLPGGSGNDFSFVRLFRRKLLESNNRYLIVLNDLWCCNDWFCLNDDDRNQKVETEEEKRTVNCFFNALPRDGTGGAVIVTSRLKEVAENMVMGRLEEEDEEMMSRRLKEEAEKKVFARNLYHLKPLDSEDESANECLRAIVKEGLHPKGQDDEELLREIVRRCHGLPLAARILGNKVKDVLIEMEKEEEERKKEEEERKKKEVEERLNKEEEERKKKQEEERLKKEEEERKKKEKEERRKKEEEESLKKEEEEAKKKDEEERRKKEEEEERLKKEEEEGKKKEEEERRKKEEEEGKKEEEERLKKEEEEGKKKEEEECLKKEEEERQNKEEERKEE